MKFKLTDLPSNRKFGFFFSGIFALLGVGGYFFLKLNSTLVVLFILLFGITFLISFLKPDLLLPFNKLWMTIGLLIGKIISPIILGIIFFLLITPIAIIMRVLGRDELRLKPVKRASHWRNRYPVGPESSSFKQQF